MAKTEEPPPTRNQSQKYHGSGRREIWQGEQYQAGLVPWRGLSQSWLRDYTVKRRWAGFVCPCHCLLGGPTYLSRLGPRYEMIRPGAKAARSRSALGWEAAIRPGRRIDAIFHGQCSTKAEHSGHCFNVASLMFAEGIRW